MLIAENIVYRHNIHDEYALEQCQLTIDRPEHDGYPVFVYFHGGGLEGGSRPEGDPFVDRMIAEGYGVVRPHYRLHPKVTCPTYIEDAAAAIAWTLENIADYGGDPSKIFITGHSAGGYLTAILCMDERYLQATGHDLNKILGGIPTSGQMLTHFTIRKEQGIPMARPVIDELAPLHYAHIAPIPMCYIAGSDDMAARVEENALMVAVSKDAGHDASILVVPGRDHCTIKNHYAQQDDPTANFILEFVHRILGS